MGGHDLFFFNVGHTVRKCFIKFHLIVGVEESIVNPLHELQIADQLFQSYVLHERSVHNRLFNAYYEVKLKKHPIANMLLNFPRCLRFHLLQTSKCDNNALYIDAIYNLKFKKS
jgi:hypothetical protein